MKKAAAARVAAAEASRAVARFGLDTTVDPADALLGEVARGAGMVRWLGEQVASMPDGDVVQAPEYAAWSMERDRLAKVAKSALDAGVDERRLALAEGQAEALASAIRAVLDGLGLSAEQRATAVAILRTQLTQLGG